MVKNSITDVQRLESGQSTQSIHGHNRDSLPLMALSTLGFVLAILLTVTPLLRQPQTLVHLYIPLGNVIAQASSWLPENPGNPSTASIELFVFLLVAGGCYGLAGLLLARQRSEQKQRHLRLCIWVGTLLAGAIFVATPAMLSYDITVYAGYSRLLGIYHANPYFVTLKSAFPHDPITGVDDWSWTVSAYGPVWMLVCAVWGWLVGPDPTGFVIAFRLFALAMHLLNIWLVGQILRTMGRSSRTVTLGMLLYAWNPLVLLESGLGGHNDVFMMSFVLAGVLLAARAEKHGILHKPSGYLPATLALTLAVLVKFTALPILACFWFYLFCTGLPGRSEQTAGFKEGLRQWPATLPILLPSLFTALLLAGIFYGPFWVGHSWQAILLSFQSPPSASGAESSFMREAMNLVQAYPENQFFVILSTRKVWDVLNELTIGLFLLGGTRYLWRAGTVSAFTILALSILCVVLLLTPWFFPWYITWLVGLAALSVSETPERLSKAWQAWALTFSFSALTLYLFNQNLLGAYDQLNILFATLPPVCAFVLVLARKPAQHLKRQSSVKVPSLDEKC